MTSVVIVDEAEAQLREIVAWWLERRPAAPTLVIDEFKRCITLLEVTPDIGSPFRRALIPGVRRLSMKRTKHLLYYMHDRDRAVVYIIAVWGAPKGGDPVLQDPLR